MARDKHPGQRNSLDALCRRYDVDNSQRELHGALLDAEILADVYLLMTGGQVGLALQAESATDTSASGRVTNATDIRRLDQSRPALRVIKADKDELDAHQQKINSLGEEVAPW
jgi:DNA polymerase-3 subunit epsilon